MNEKPIETVVEKTLCGICAQDNQRAFYWLIYKLRGTYTCDKCGKQFTVRKGLLPNAQVASIQ